jgi:hypothetical protein
MAQRPNFSGEWRLNRQASKLSAVVAPAVRSGTLKIRHLEPQLASHLTIEFADGPIESRMMGVGLTRLSKSAVVVATRTIEQRAWNP